MALRSPRIDRIVWFTAASAFVALAFAVVGFCRGIESRDWLWAVLTLLALTVVSTAMALQISEAGSNSSLEFIPQLGAVLLVGPCGTVLVALGSQLIAQFLLYQKELPRRIFNVSQVILSAAAASFTYIWFGGNPSLVELSLPDFAPFALAVVAYFAVNTGTVCYIVSAAEGRRFIETWRQMTGGLVLFDLAMSLLAFFVALFYILWGPIVLLAALIPLFGLRYSYGVNYELKQLNTDLLRLMIKTIEAQDPYTSGHSIRVAEMSKRLARLASLGSKDVRKIETAALLHDIGKIDVAFGEILRQAGPLTPEQRELIRTHPDRGVEILQSIRSLHPDILNFVRHHHERIDGEGYPAGLSGEAIPFGARIIMICDTIDAMRTARPYRDPLSLPVIREELSKYRGTQFDSDLVDILLASDVLEQAAAFEVAVPPRAEPAMTPKAKSAAL